MSEVRQFFRLRFSKQGDVRFTSHHDLMRLFERVMRRARLPVAMSGGFNPRPRISLPAPLSVGFLGRNEILDFELERWLRPEEVRRRFEEQLPAGIRIESLQNVPSKPDRRPRQFFYLVHLLDGHPVTAARLNELLEVTELIVERSYDGRTKTLDIRPFIGRIRLRGSELHLLFEVSERGTARPEEVLQFLGCKPAVHYLKGAIERTNVNLSSSL